MVVKNSSLKFLSQTCISPECVSSLAHLVIMQDKVWIYKYIQLQIKDRKEPQFSSETYWIQSVAVPNPLTIKRNNQRPFDDVALRIFCKQR